MADKNVIIIGPPGCGKTTHVANRTRATVKKYGEDDVLIASLTRAAATEAAGRDTGINPENVGTGHSHCFGLLEKPVLVTAKMLTMWNEKYPLMSLSPSSAIQGRFDIEEQTPIGGNRGDELLQLYDLARAKMVPVDKLHPTVRQFASYWTEWKKKEGILDFTDLITECLAERPFAPNSPRVIILDERQDFSILEMALFRHWAISCEALVEVGDPDQALFGWRGADGFRTNEQPDTVLSQSYRVPKAIHRIAKNIIARSRTANKYAQYDARDEEGYVVSSPCDYSNGSALVQMAQKELARGNRSVMVLMSCDYMLTKFVKELKAQGLPYHNPYGKKWNPFTPSQGISIADRVLALLSISPNITKNTGGISFWDFRNIELWLPLLKLYAPSTGHGLVKRGKATGDTTYMELMEGIDKSWNQQDIDRRLRLCLNADAVQKILDADLSWIQASMQARFKDAAPYTMKVLRSNPQELINFMNRSRGGESFGIIPGTIHSVKGGEADSVIVAPDLSQAGWKTLHERGWNGADAVWRTFYVAVTRARIGLTLLKPHTHMAVQW